LDGRPVRSGPPKHHPHSPIPLRKAPPSQDPVAGAVVDSTPSAQRNTPLPRTASMSGAQPQHHLRCAGEINLCCRLGRAPLRPALPWRLRRPPRSGVPSLTQQRRRGHHSAGLFPRDVQRQVEPFTNLDLPHPPLNQADMSIADPVGLQFRVCRATMTTLRPPLSPPWHFGSERGLPSEHRARAR